MGDGDAAANPGVSKMASHLAGKGSLVQSPQKKHADHARLQNTERSVPAIHSPHPICGASSRHPWEMNPGGFREEAAGKLLSSRL